MALEAGEWMGYKMKGGGRVDTHGTEEGARERIPP